MRHWQKGERGGGEGEGERENKVKIKRVKTDTFMGVECRKEHRLLRGSEASPARPSGRSSKKMKTYEDVRMVTVVA
jgi:hypothetical protein